MFDIPFDWSPVWITLRLATITTGILLLLGTPLAWWLAHTKCWCKSIIEAAVALPLVLPPTVLGFYLLVTLGPNGPVGSFWQSLTGGHLAFTFSGLVIGLVFFSLPFAVHPFYEHVEMLEFQQAHILSAGMLLFYFIILVTL